MDIKTNGLLFKSKIDNNYFYDNNSGHIFYLDDLDELRKLNAYFNLVPKKIVNEKVDISEGDIKFCLYDLACGFKQMIIETTSVCNLRCRYCTYSNHYEFTRSHGQDSMNFLTSKRAVDYYFENFKIIYDRNANRKPIISFYGGEPLINFDLIKKTVEYINRTYSNYEVDYHITTNGILLTNEIMKFLYDNKFYVLLSLDGYKENHDRNRVNLENKETFDIVINNYNRFKKKYPDIAIFISACYDYKTDLKKMIDFFDKNQIELLQANQVDGSSKSYYNQFSHEEKVKFFYKLNEIKSLFEKQSSKNLKQKSNSLSRLLNPIYAGLAYHQMMGEYNLPVKPHTATCIPGEKIYITVKGDIQTCEKVGKQFKIGNVFSGLDFEKIAKIMTEYNNFVCKNCSRCPVSRLCTLCFKNFQSEDGIGFNPEACKQEISIKKVLLKEYVSLLEANPCLFDEITTDYYKQLELGGGMF